MSVCKSGHHRIQVTFHGLSSHMSMNQNYTSVLRREESLGATIIPEVFRQNRDEYFRRVLTDVGNYGSGRDFKHYDDPRCKCILCWVFRSIARPEDYPTVRAKLLCVEEQLRESNVHPDMNYLQFTDIVHNKVPGIKSETVEYLWSMMFKSIVPKRREETYNLESLVGEILEGSDIVTLRNNDLIGVDYPASILTKLNALQSRIDKDYAEKRKADQLIGLTDRELTRIHVHMLQEKFQDYGFQIDTGLESLWKHMFKHDHLVKVFSSERLKKVKYSGFEDVRSSDRRQVLFNTAARFEAKLIKMKTSTYAVDPLERQKMETAYSEFNTHFDAFLTANERKNFENLFESANIDSQLSRSFKGARMYFMLDYLKQKSRRLIDNAWRPYFGKSAATVKAEVSQDVWNTIHWVPVLEKYLKRVDVETKIHQFGFTSKMDTRLDCKQAVRDYIERIWIFLRGGGADKPKFMALRRKLNAERLKEYTQEYIDNKMYQYYVDFDQKNRVDRKWTNYILKVVTDFTSAYNLKSRYNPKRTRAIFVQQTQYGIVDELSGPTERQVFLDMQYSGDGGYEEKAKLDFYILEFSPRIRDIWNVVSWYELRKKNHFLWRTTYDLSEISKKEEMLLRRQQYREEALKMAKKSDKTTAEMYLIFDIFGGWDVDDKKLDVFISKNLPLKERRLFVHEMGSMKKMLANIPQKVVSAPMLKELGFANKSILEPMLKKRMKYIRRAFKKIVFDKEIIKRAVMIQLRRENAILQGLWSDEILTTRDRAWGMTNGQRAMQMEYYEYIDLDLKELFPYNPDWVSYKYKNIHKWLAPNARVYALCRYEDVIETEIDVRGLQHYNYTDNETPEWDDAGGYYRHSRGIIEWADENGYWVRKEQEEEKVELAPRYTAMLTGLPKVWTDTEGHTEKLVTGWVEGIGSTFVYLRLEKPVSVKKLTGTRQLGTIRVAMANVYDNVLEYNIMRERAASKRQEEMENEQELERMEQLKRERRQLLRLIAVAETSEEQREMEHRRREEQNALLMFDDSKAEERRRLFNEWLAPITDGFETPQAKMQYTASRQAECRAEDGDVKLQMFKDGRRQWLTETGIDRKRPYKERSPSMNMRTETEQRQFFQTLLIEETRTNARRATSNRFTNEYMKFAYVYPRNGITDADIKMRIMEKIEDKERSEKIDFMTDYKTEMSEAMQREDLRFHRIQTRASSALRRRRVQINDIIDDVISDITRVDMDPRLKDEMNVDVKNYIMSGSLNRDSDIRLKTPKLKYTAQMWESEVELSLQPLDRTAFTMLVDYVGKKHSGKLTEYQQDYKTKNTKGGLVYPTPDSRSLVKVLQLFKPSRRGKFTTNVRVAMGPGSWFQIDQLSDLMRRTNMSMEDRLLFGLEVQNLPKETNPDRARSIRIRMKDVGRDNASGSIGDTGWRVSDGDGTIRIVDDFVGEFRFSNGRSFRIANDDDIPTHLRLNCVYCDTVRGKVGDKSVRKLVPYYVVSLYMKEGTDYRRLRVRNRGHGTFLPRQVKHKTKMYSVEDYKGYACSICLSQEEFDSLILDKQMTPGVARRTVQLPVPILPKYHKLLYARAKTTLEKILINRKRNPTAGLLSEPLVQIAGPDDMNAPYSDGMIRLGSAIETLTDENGALCAGGRYFDIDGNQISPPLAPVRIKHNQIKHDQLIVNGELANTFPYAVELHSIRSETTLATYGQQRTTTPFFTVGVVHIWVYRKGGFEQRHVVEANCSILKWCKDILLAVQGDVVRGYGVDCSHVLTLRGHADAITCLDVRKHQIVTGSLDNTLICWKNKEPALASGARVLVKDSNYRFGDIESIESGNACSVKLLKTPKRPARLATFECTPSAHSYTMHGHTYGVESVVWGGKIVSSSQDKTVIIWKRGTPLSRLGFAALKLVEPDMETSYKRLANKIPKSQPHLVKAYLTKNAPKLALVAPTVVFYGVGSILGKLDISKGECIPFADDVVNSVSELPPPPRVVLGPFRPFFNEDGSVYSVPEPTREFKPLDRYFESLKDRKRRARRRESYESVPLENLTAWEEVDELDVTPNSSSDSEWEDVTPGDVEINRMRDTFEQQQLEEQMTPESSDSEMEVE